ncbi:MAG: PAS domain-containing protein, partial [Burkholderiales bacterium]
MQATDPTIADTTRAALESAQHGIVLLSDGVADCNAHFCRMLESELLELTGKPILELCPELQADGALSSERWQRRCHAAAAGLPQWFPWQFRSRSGRRVHSLVHLRASAGTGPDLIAHVHDLSNLREAPWIKPETRARLQDVLEHTKAVIFAKDRDGKYVFANR